MKRTSVFAIVSSIATAVAGVVGTWSSAFNLVIVKRILLDTLSSIKIAVAFVENAIRAGIGLILDTGQLLVGVAPPLSSSRYSVLANRFIVMLRYPFFSHASCFIATKPALRITD